MRGGYKMLSKNNFNEKLRQMDNQKDHFAIRKLTIGVASVLIGITFMGFGGQAVHAAEVTNTQPAVEQVSKEITTDSTQQNNDAPKDVATAQKTEVATDSQANNQTDNTKESAQLVKPITQADVKATTESRKAEIADKTNEVKPSDTQVQEKQKEQTSEVKTPDTTSNKDEQKSDQTQRLVVDKKATENTQAATDIAAEKLQAKIQARIALRAKSESQFNVDDWDGSLNNTTHEYTLNNYHGIDKENIYIPNTEDFIKAGKITDIDKVFITKDLIQNITKNGATSIVIDDQGSEDKNKVYAKGDWSKAFAGFTKLKSVDLSHLDTSQVTSMAGAFNGDTGLNDANLSGWNIQNMTNLSSLFYGANNLYNVDMSGWNFINNPNTNSMFSYADYNLKSVNLKNTKNVTDDILRIYARAIKNSNATTADLSDINLSPNVTSLNGLFSNMTKLKNVNLSGLDISHITDMGGMFSGDSSLESLDLSGLDLSKVTNTNNMFYRVGGKNIKSVNITNTKSIPRSILDIYLKALSNAGTKTIDLSGINLSPSITSFNNLFSNMPNIESIDLTGWDTGNITDMSYMFFNDPKLKTIKGLEDFKTFNVTNMAYMFYDLENIDDSELDLTGWDTSNVTDMSYMFSKMFLQKDLSFVNDWKTGKVTDMSYMFANDKNLEKLDLSKWDVSSVGLKNTEQNYSLARMFSDDINLTTVGDLSKWADKTGNVHDTRWMFYNTPKLENVDLHGWNTGKLQIAEGMFWKSGAKHINLDGWNLSGLKRITDAGYVEGSPNPGHLPILRGNEHMFQDLVNKSVISMNGVTLPKAGNTAFMVDDFSGDKPIIVIANGKDGKALDDLLKLNTQKWTTHQDITGRQNSDFITYVRADDNTKQIGHHGLNFIFTNLKDLHNYFNKVTNRDAVEADMANDPNGKQLVHDWNAQNDVDGNNIVKTVRRVSPDSSYDPYSMAIHDVDGKGNMLADLMTSKYQLNIVAPTTTTETKNPTRKIIIENPDGSTRTKKQTVEFTRNVTKHIDGTEEDTPWTPASGNWDHFDVPQHDGYDSYIDGVAGTSIGVENINADTDNVTIHVTYKSNTPDNPTPDNPEPEKTKPETPEVPNTPDEPNEPEKPTVPKKNDKHKKSNKSEDKAKNKKNSKIQNAGAHGQAAPRAATAPNRLVAPKGDQLATGKGFKELNNKPASAAKANANNKETLPQTGEEKDNVGLLGLGLLALAALGFVDRKRRD